MKTDCMSIVFTIGESSAAVKNFQGVLVKPNVSVHTGLLEGVFTTH